MCLSWRGKKSGRSPAQTKEKRGRGTQAAGIRALTPHPPLCHQSQENLKEPSLDLAREAYWLPKGYQVPR